MSSNPVSNRTRDRKIDDFDNHSYDYSPNWTPLGPITIINCKRKKVTRTVELVTFPSVPIDQYLPQ